MSYRICFKSIVVIILVCFSPSAARARPEKTYARQLALESDALLSDAIHRPYGWAWDPDGVAEPQGRTGMRILPRPVSMQILATPSAGLILLWSGRLLDEARYVHGAEEAARAVAAAQMPTGMIQSRPIFGANAGGHDAQAVIPDRAPTCAALGLLLAVLDDRSTASAQSSTMESQVTIPSDAAHLEAIRRAAARSANWLVRQQTPNWAVAKRFSSKRRPQRSHPPHPSR